MVRPPALDGPAWLVLLAALGAHAWWAPRWLQRVPPEIDIEGSGTPAPAGAVPTPRESADEQVEAEKP